MPQILIRFRHGLGDAVQLTTVLRHLADERPDWEIDVAALKGKHSALIGLCRRVYQLDEPGQEQPDPDRYDDIYDLQWPECYHVWPDSPATKAELCLREVFGIAPRDELTSYSVGVTLAQHDAAHAYFREIGADLCEDDKNRYKSVVIHYEGNTSASEKNLTHEQAWLVCETALDLGYVPVVLDWDRRSPLPDDPRIHCPDRDHEIWGGTGTGDAAMITALCDHASLVVAIDSGPQKCAAATDTPTIAVWRGHHPLHFIAPAGHVLNLIPQGHGGLLRGDTDTGLPYFESHYQSRLYTDLTAALAETTAQLLAPDDLEPQPLELTKVAGVYVRRAKMEQDLVIVRDVLSLDGYGLRRNYAERLRDAKLIIDIGAHIGCFARLAHGLAPDARIVCVEACPENLPALRANVAEFADVIHAACVYGDGDVVLLNAVTAIGSLSTGGSAVVSADDPRVARHDGHNSVGQYRTDHRHLGCVTLEDLLGQPDDVIDVLKLDCEGSEYSILRDTRLLPQIRLIVGEWHGSLIRWHHLLWDRFFGPAAVGQWGYSDQTPARNRATARDNGTFHLRNKTLCTNTLLFTSRS